MADIKQAFGSSTAITITLASLADNAERESTAVDNSSDKFLDALVYLAIKSGSSVSGEECVNVYAYGSEDGTNYDGGCTGSDAAYTLDDPTTLHLVKVIPTPAATTTYEALFSIAQAFGGILPKKWGLVIENLSGAALDSTEGNHDKNYTGIYATSS